MTIALFVLTALAILTSLIFIIIDEMILTDKQNKYLATLTQEQKLIIYEFNRLKGITINDYKAKQTKAKNTKQNISNSIENQPTQSK